MITLTILSLLSLIFSIRKIYIDSERDWKEFNPYNSNVLAYLGLVVGGSALLVGFIFLCILKLP